MSKKVSITDPFQPKITRNDRFAQMSHQEKVIEQKKKEIQAKLDAKLKNSTDSTQNKVNNTPKITKQKTVAKKVDNKKSDSTAGFNLFSNDGSFLDTFKQMKDRRIDSKLKSFKNKEIYDNKMKCFSDVHSTVSGSKISRWSQRRRSLSPNDHNLTKSNNRISSFLDPKITINSTITTVQHHNFENSPQQLVQITPQTVTGQPLLKNLIQSATTVNFTQQQNSPTVIAAPPLLLNVPPPQIVQNPATLVLPATPTNVLVTTTPTVNVTLPPISEVLTTVTLPPPPQQQTIITPQTVTVTTNNTIQCGGVELASIPPPNPIQVQNIPQPEPINTLNIPHPAPIQVQNIPTPTSIQLNEIPNPKPLDLLTIPTPNEEKSISDPDFIKNIPPPNKSIPPPNLNETNINIPPPNNPQQPTNNLQQPPPQAAVVTTTTNLLSPPPIPPPPPPTNTQTIQQQQQNLTVQNILVHTIPPPPTQFQTLTTTTSIPPPNITQQPPPQQQQQPTPVGGSTFASVASISVTLPVVNQTTNTIPSLMAQPILPPPGMGMTTVNVNCPPPLTLQQSSLPPPSPTIIGQATTAAATFINQPPPNFTNQMPPMNIPPPTTNIVNSTIGVSGSYQDMNAGTPDYEAMASLGRMVAQCGPGIEEIVRQRKTQDPTLWFLFHKESAAYQQYRQLVEQFIKENENNKNINYKPEDIYEPEMAIEDEQENNIKKEDKPQDVNNLNENNSNNEGTSSNKRKRKSRWGDKDISVPPPTTILINNNNSSSSSNNQTGMNLPPNIVPIHQQQPIVTNNDNNQLMLTKVTRTDAGLIQYAINTFGSANLTEDEWKRAEDHFKINLLYQDMIKKREELEKIQKTGRNKYDYDSDEDVEGGTWEHKLRDKEMMATQLWAQELTRQAEGKHHIGDFLPPEELKRFMEKSNASKEGRVPNFSDYKEFKIKEDNIGFKMLQKLGWSEGQGLGANGAGIVEPVNKAPSRDQNQGLGLTNADDSVEKEDEYEAYRKRMMLAYRFRPNPLNNPRRPYY